MQSPSSPDVTRSARSASRILEEARKLIGQPWRHQDNDCAAFLIKVGLAVPVGEPLYSALIELRDDPKYRNYSHDPDPRLIKTFLDKHLAPVFKRDLEPGDIIVIAYVRPQHLAIVGDKGHPLSMIHNHGRPMAGSQGRIEEHGLTDPWLRRIKYCYRWLD